MANDPLKNFLKKIKVSESTVSGILGALVVVFVGILIFNYFRNIGKLPEEITTPTSEPTSEKQITEITPAELPTTYTVKAGDNLWKIAEAVYGSGYNWVDISRENSLKNPDSLAVGQVIELPKVEPKRSTITAKTQGTTIIGESYTVVKGDNLWEIAVRAYGDGYKWTEIAKTNNLKNPGLIHAGNTLTIPR